MKALSPLPLQSSLLPSFLLLSVFSCIVCYRGSSSLLLSLPGAACHPDGSLHSSFFCYDYFLSNSFTASPAFFFLPQDFVIQSCRIHTHTHNYLCTLRLSPRQFIPRARRRREDDIDPGSGCKSSVKLSPPLPPAKLLSFELINTKKKKKKFCCLFSLKVAIKGKTWGLFHNGIHV